MKKGLQTFLKTIKKSLINIILLTAMKLVLFNNTSFAQGTFPWSRRIPIDVEKILGIWEVMDRPDPDTLLVIERTKERSNGYSLQLIRKMENGRCKRVDQGNGEMSLVLNLKTPDMFSAYFSGGGLVQIANFSPYNEDTNNFLRVGLAQFNNNPISSIYMVKINELLTYRIRKTASLNCQMEEER